MPASGLCHKSNAEDLLYYAEMLEVCQMVIAQMLSEHCLPEETRSRIHALTRRVRITDLEIVEIGGRITKENRQGFLIEALKDLRDRYEEIKH